MNPRLLLTLSTSLLVVLPSLPAQEAKPAESTPAAETPAKPKPDFIRFRQEESTARLETAVKSYANADGVTVDLVGVVHIADKSYYQKLNERLAGYDAVLYELVGDPAALKDETLRKPDNPLRSLQKLAGGMLKLDFQLDNIDYTRPNFVHADLNEKQFGDRMKARGESLMSLLGRAMKMERRGGIPGQKEMQDLALPEILAALGSGDGADGIKIVMAKMFGHAEEMIDSFEGKEGTVLLAERNQVVAEKLKECVGGGKKKLAIFYGAGHLQGLEELIGKQGFEPKQEEWLAAWTMKKKPAAAPKPPTGTGGKI